MQEQSGQSQAAETGTANKLALFLFGIFLIITSIIAALAAITVLVPHSPLVWIWSFKEAAFHQLLAFQLPAGGGFAILSFLLALAAFGWFQDRRWAWFLSTLILSVNLISDLAHMVIAKEWLDAIGILLEGIVLLWITSKSVRNHFMKTQKSLRE